jgi:serine/threonine protein kinase
VDRIGDYRVEREIRHEDIGTTYKGVHLVLPRVAAIRVLAAGHKPLAIQLLREACILEALSHPGVPRVFECGVLADDGDKRPWVAMELVEGPTIGELCREGPMAISDLVVAIRTIAEVLEHAHARGVIHLRLTDSSIVRTPQRHAPFTVIGWGAVITRDSSTAPEPSHDIHALGTLAFRALTGTPYTSDASAHIAAPSAPHELAQLIDDLVVARPPTATEVRDRATWLAETFEPRRSTQDLGKPQAIADEPSGVFNIRIHH